MAKKSTRPAPRRKHGAENPLHGERQTIIETAEQDFVAQTGLSPFVIWKKGEWEAALRGEITEFDDPRKAADVARARAKMARKPGEK